MQLDAHPPPAGANDARLKHEREPRLTLLPLLELFRLRDHVLDLLARERCRSHRERPRALKERVEEPLRFLEPGFALALALLGHQVVDFAFRVGAGRSTDPVCS
jgi:hypothetical protein